MTSLGNAPGAQRQCHRPQRKVDQEDALPSGPLYEQAAQQRPKHQRQRAEGGPSSDGARPLAGVRKRMGEEGHRTGDQQRSRHALDRAADHQDRQIGGARADQ